MPVAVCRLARVETVKKDFYGSPFRERLACLHASENDRIIVVSMYRSTEDNGEECRNMRGKAGEKSCPFLSRQGQSQNNPCCDLELCFCCFTFPPSFVYFDMFALNPNDGGKDRLSSQFSQNLLFFGQLGLYFALIRGAYAFFSSREVVTLKD
jgi:hypothetical protein